MVIRSRAWCDCDRLAAAGLAEAGLAGDVVAEAGVAVPVLAEAVLRGVALARTLGVDMDP
ncbi:unannotated protein [freshwater metagenome]|uniref:Unannotated protein n=1 Tax=freshwater metagenome TaxID=449393 RepID=A0A6J6CLS3_9ZZZZ